MSKNTAKRIHVPAAVVTESKPKASRKERAPFKVRFQKTLSNFAKMAHKAAGYSEATAACLISLVEPLKTLNALVNDMPIDFVPVGKTHRTPAVHLSVGMLVTIRDTVFAPRTKTDVPLDQYDWILGCKPQGRPFRIDAINTEKNMLQITDTENGKSIAVKFGHIRTL
jgi:hypothetical protein